MASVDGKPCSVLVWGVGLLAALAQAGSCEEAAERNKSATQVAKAWFTSLMQGETAVTTSLSAVPFAFDSKQEVKSLVELKKLYDRVVERKGKRDIKPTSIRVASSSAEKVEVIVMIEDEAVAISVRPGDAFRVVGFRD